MDSVVDRPARPAGSLTVRAISPMEFFNAFFYDPLVLELGSVRKTLADYSKDAHVMAMTAGGAGIGVAAPWPSTEDTLADMLRNHDEKKRLLVVEAQAAGQGMVPSSSWTFQVEQSGALTAGGQSIMTSSSAELSALVCTVAVELPTVTQLDVVVGGTPAVLAAYPFMAQHDPMVCYPQQVLEGTPVYIGSEFCAGQAVVIADLGITHIVNATSECRHYFADDGRLQYLRVPVMDECSAPIAKHFAGVSTFIEEALANGGSVLVHCAQGRSRSASCLLAWLLTRDPTLTLEAGVAKCQAARPYVQPNPGFMLQLRQYAATLSPAKTPTSKSDELK